MNNFYKGGRELTYFKQILHSIYTLKNKCNIQKIARQYPIVHDVLKDNIIQPTNIALNLLLCCDKNLLILRESIVPDSGLDCHSFGYLLLNNQIISKEIVIKQQRISKQGATKTLCRSLEEAKKQPRNGNESVMKHQANGNESVIKHQRNSRETATKYQANGKETAINRQTNIGVKPNQVRTVFYPEAQFYHSNIASAPYLHQEKSGATTAQILSVSSRTYKKVRRKLKESTNNVRKILSEQNSRSMSLYAKVNASSTRKTYMERVLSKISGFKAFHSLSQVLVRFRVDDASNRSKFLLNKVKTWVKDDVREDVGFQILKSVRVMMILALTVSMFSLSAQTPRKDSGADGCKTKGLTNLNQVVESVPITNEFTIDQVLKANGKELIDRFPLVKNTVDTSLMGYIKYGDPIEREIWDLPLEVLNHPENKTVTTLRELSDTQYLVLDFWALWCKPCMKSMIHWEEINNQVKNKITIVGVHMDFDYKAQLEIEKRGWKLLQIVGKNAKILNRYFSSSSILGPSVWIAKGRYLGASIAVPKSYEYIYQLRDGSINTIPPYALHKMDYQNKQGGQND